MMANPQPQNYSPDFQSQFFHLETVGMPVSWEPDRPSIPNVGFWTLIGSLRDGTGTGETTRKNRELVKNRNEVLGKSGKRSKPKKAPGTWEPSKIIVSTWSAEKKMGFGRYRFYFKQRLRVGDLADGVFLPSGAFLP